MGWFERSPKTYLAGFVVSLILTIVVGLFGAVAALGAMFSGGFWLLNVLEASLPFLIGLVVLGVLDLFFLVGTIAATLRQTSMPKSDRLVKVAERAEKQFPFLEQFDASKRVEPGDEQRREKLRQKYIDGEISEQEFERRVGEYVDDDDTMVNDPDYLDGKFDEGTEGRETDAEVADVETEEMDDETDDETGTNVEIE